MRMGGLTAEFAMVYNLLKWLTEYRNFSDVQVPMAVAAPIKPREKRGLKIINPSTGKDIFDTEPTQASTAAVSTASHTTPPAEPAQV
jgi:hypothetical protein